MDNSENRFYNLVLVKGGVDGLFSRFDRDIGVYKAFYDQTGGPRAFAELAYADPDMQDAFVELFSMALRERQMIDELPRIGGRGPDKAPRKRRTRAELLADAKAAEQARRASLPPKSLRNPAPNHNRASH
jgi:hypothetical protein